MYCIEDIMEKIDQQRRSNNGHNGKLYICLYNKQDKLLQEQKSEIRNNYLCGTQL
jgi:hypothetical protein